MRCCNKFWFILPALLSLALTPGAVPPVDLVPTNRPPVTGPIAPVATNGLPVTVEPDLRTALSAAEKDKGLVLVVFHAAWCGPCRQMERDVFAAEAFREHGGPLHYVRVDVDAEPKIASQYNVSAIPDMLILGADGKIVSRRKGAMPLADFINWLAEARERRRRGEWEGIAPGSKLRGLIESSPGRLATNELAELIDWLGTKEPAERVQVMRTLALQREAVIPPLIEAVMASYLGTRIGAADTLRQMAPGVPAIDPWATPAELTNTVVALRQWWSELKQLPETQPAAALDTGGERALAMALEHVTSDEPAWRTEGMAALVRLGDAALPAVREAIQRAERKGDQRTVWALEEVRWTMLVPDHVERQAVNVRRDLARGTSNDRQAATERLTRAGPAALPILAVLIVDPDPLVKEVALKSLSKLGGKDSLATMAILLKSGDSNLRMTAAQALGATKKKEAAPYLASALEDSNELVVGAAIAALEEIQAKDQGPALIKALADPRWRVRAAAAEALGKMQLKEAAEPLSKLLNDPDEFVVRTVLQCLRQLQTPPGTPQLLAVIKRIPSLKRGVVEFLAEEDNESVATVIHSIYKESSVADQSSILHTLAHPGRGGHGSSEKGGEYWKPLILEALGSSDVAVRRDAASFVVSRGPDLGTALIDRLLVDSDPQVQDSAALTVLKLAALNWIGTDDAASRYRSSNPSKPKSTDWKKDHEAWHATLQKSSGATPGLAMAFALYATGDGRADLPPLTARLKNIPTGQVADSILQFGMPVLMQRLTLPEGDEVVDLIGRSPRLLSASLANVSKSTPAVREKLLVPERLVASLEQMSGEELGNVVESMLESRNQKPALLLSPNSTQDVLVVTMLTAKQPLLRAAAVYASVNRGATNLEELATQALNDENPGVKKEGVKALVQVQKDRARLEAKLGPLLADSDSQLATTAALALLEPEVRQAAGSSDFEGFQFGSVHVWNYNSRYRANEDRPLEPLANRPEFLGKVRERLARTPDRATQYTLALLLAQYGDYSGVDDLIAHWQPGEMNGINQLLIGIGFSKDPKYVTFLQMITADPGSKGLLPQVLKAMRGMPGDGVRQLRVEINKRSRENRE